MKLLGHSGQNIEGEIVNDDRQIIGLVYVNGIGGLKRDGCTGGARRNSWQQRIANSLKPHASNYSPNLLAVQFAEVDGKWVAKVDVKPTKGAKVLLDGKLYVRDLMTTVELDPTTMAQYGECGGEQ